MVIIRARKWLMDSDVREEKGKGKREKLYRFCVCVHMCAHTHLHVHVHPWALGRHCFLSPSFCLSSYLEMLTSLGLWHLHEGDWVHCPIVSPRRHVWSHKALSCLWEQHRLKTQVLSDSSGTEARRSCWLFTGSASWEPFPHLLVRDKMERLSNLPAVPSGLWLPKSQQCQW